MKLLPAVARKIEFGDPLLLLYALVFVRQVTWALPNQFVAWTIAVVITLSAWALYLYYKPETAARIVGPFWAIVVLPLLFVYVLRVALPDLSFDVLNHRLIQGERALRGPQFLPGDFFPNVFPFNPSSDMLTGIYRHVLGYRLGTIVNLLAIVWTGTIVEKMLRPVIAIAWIRCFGVLAVLFTEHIMFEINNYMVDLLALPLLLEATRVVVGTAGSNPDVSWKSVIRTPTQRWDLGWAALLMGGAIGLKLTNVAVVVPIMFILVLRTLAARPVKLSVVYLTGVGILLLLPMLPHVIYIYRETGSPFFPLYNNVFGSRFWPAIAFSDGRWGPKSWSETLSWPLLSFWVPKRLSELAVYGGRLTLSFIASLVCIVLPRVPGRIRLLGLVCFLGSLIWSATSGYARYALFVEIIGGMLILFLFAHFFHHVRPLSIGIVVAMLLLGLLLGQCVLSIFYVRRTEWGGRPINLATTLREMRWIGRDQNLRTFQTWENSQRFSQVDAWIVSSVKSNGVETLLRPDVPALGVNYPEYFARPESRRRFALALESLQGKHVYTLTLNEELVAAREFLNQRNLGVGQTQDLSLSFFSPRNQFHMTMIEVLLPNETAPQRRPPDQPDETEVKGPLNDSAFQAELSASDAPTRMNPGQTAIVSVQVRNVSNYFWPSRNQKSSKFTISAADVWLRPDAKTLVNNLDGRTTLPRDLWPGESMTVELSIKAPGKPGEYVLEIDLVQEDVAFFKDKGSSTWRWRVKVE